MRSMSSCTDIELDWRARDSIGNGGTKTVAMESRDWLVLSQSSSWSPLGPSNCKSAASSLLRVADAMTLRNANWHCHTKPQSASLLSFKCNEFAPVCTSPLHTIATLVSLLLYRCPHRHRHTQLTSVTSGTELSKAMQSSQTVRLADSRLIG